MLRSNTVRRSYPDRGAPWAGYVSTLGVETRKGHMPPRTNPTARQERLGAELRKMREAAGVTAREAAGLLGSGPTQISHIEAGRFGISEDRIRRLAAHYACNDRQ